MGGVPLWVSALAEVLTLGLAIVVLRAVSRLLRAVDGRLAAVEELYRRDSDQRARSQAQLVCAWPVSEKETFQSVIRRGIVGAAIRNGSEAPVYNVELVFTDRPAAWRAVRHVGLVRPSAEAEVHAGFDEEETYGTPSPERRNADGTVRLAPSADMAVEIWFTDGRGVRWRRDAAGALTEVDAVATG